MPERRNALGRAPGVPGVRPCRLLRLLARQARDEALPRDGAPGDALRHAGGYVDVVLRPQGVRAPRASSPGCLALLTDLGGRMVPFPAFSTGRMYGTSEWVAEADVVVQGSVAG